MPGQGMFVASDFIPSGLILASQMEGFIEAGTASLAGTTGIGSGFLGELELKVGEGFVDSTYFAVVVVGYTNKDNTLIELPVTIIGRLEAAGGLVGGFSGDGIRCIRTG